MIPKYPVFNKNKDTIDSRNTDVTKKIITLLFRNQDF